jgi:peptidoglycan hydrolase CwlO-like protein
MSNYESQLKSLITEGMGQKAFEAWLMNPQERRGEVFQALARDNAGLKEAVRELMDNAVVEMVVEPSDKNYSILLKHKDELEKEIERLKEYIEELQQHLSTIE